MNPSTPHARHARAARIIDECGAGPAKFEPPLMTWGRYVYDVDTDSVTHNGGRVVYWGVSSAADWAALRIARHDRRCSVAAWAKCGKHGPPPGTCSDVNSMIQNLESDPDPNSIAEACELLDAVRHAVAYFRERVTP